MMDSCYDNAPLTGWHHGFPDAMVRLDPATMRNVPWDNNIFFFPATSSQPAARHIRSVRARH